MKRQICFVFLLFSILICGVSAVSAEDVSIADMEISDISTSSNLNVGESISTSSNDINFTIDVRYEYSDDKSKIAPDFVVKADGNEIAYEKCLDENSKYILKLNQTSLSNIYNISVMASGYISNSQSINGDLLNDITFNLDATDSYKLGRELVINADKELDFSNAADVLVISSAGVPKYKGQTSQDAIEAIYNYQFKYGRSIPYNNVLMLRQTATDTIDFAFIVKKGKKLMAVIYENASKTPAYIGTISEDMTKDQWNNYFKALSGENAWAFASLANAWVDGAPNIVLQEAAFHGHVCEGTLGVYSIVQALLKYYPPIQSTPGEFGSPGDISSYKILGVPGGSDDDAVLFFLDATPGKSGYVGFNTTSTGATENMIAFIRWNNDHGDIVVMTYNITSNKNLFKKETGVNADDGSLEELKYNTWWINKIKNNPEDLVDILYEFSNLNENHYYNLIGNGKDVEAKGLDLEYILSLNLPKATRSNAVSTTGSLSKAQLEQIGIDATNKALEIFKANGYELSKDETDLGVFTSAGYVYLNTQETADIRIGLNKALGATLTSSTLLPIHVAVWKPLWFTYVLRNQNSDELMAVYLRYNPDGTWYIGQVGGGPAGLEAARVAAIAGHKVAIYDKGSRLGGTMRTIATAEFKVKIKELADYFETQLQKLGVEIHLNTTVNGDEDFLEKADVILVGTGTKPFVPNIPGIDSANVIDIMKAHSDESLIKGDNIVICGGGLSRQWKPKACKHSFRDGRAQTNSRQGDRACRRFWFCVLKAEEF